MSGKKSIIILAGICLLLVGIAVLNPFTQQNSIIDKENNNINNNINDNNNNDDKVDNSNSFFINNWDNINHEVTVELLDSKNASVFKESYTSVPGETLDNKFPVTLEPGEEIKVTLDNNITKTQIVSEDLEGLVLYIDIDMVDSDPLFVSTAYP